MTESIFNFRTETNRTIRGAAIVCLLGLLCSPLAIGAQSGEALREARRVMAMTPVAAKKHIAGLSPAKAGNLLSQVRFLARKKNPDLDKVYYLVQHLETLRATSLAQKRLNNLLLVLGTTLGLFTIFLVYVILDQRRTMLRLQQLLGKGETRSSAAPEVYQGE